MRLQLLLLTVLAVFLAGCGGPQNMLGPAGPAARDISTLSWIVLGIFSAVAVIMWVLLGWTALRRRGSLSEHEPVDIGGGQNWILTGGFVIPFVILATVFVLGLRTMMAFPVNDGKHDRPDIRVTGHQWWWEVQYLDGAVDRHFTTANEIHIPAGRPVDIELESADVIHSFWVPKLHGKEDLVPGQPNLIRIEADRPGIYSGQCAEFCGAQHAHMMLVVVAQPEAEYQAWMAGQVGSSAQPVNGEQALGQQIFLAKPCALCHTIRGTEAHATVGPDLTHLASRQGIAANMLPNNEANLAAWVTHAQALKPASRMPNVTQLSGLQLQSLVAYLQSLN
jgi:cytochrome c oxidase subunit 2